MAETVGPGSAQDVQDTPALWTFLTAISGVNDELERARLAATGLPALLPCDVSGLALLLEPEGTWHLALQQDGQQLESPIVDQVRADLEDLSQEAFRQPGLLAVTTGGQAEGCHVPAAIEKVGVQCLAVVPLMTLHHRLGILFAGRRHPDPFPQADVAVLLTLAEHLATGIENLRLSRTLRQYSHDLEGLVAERTEELTKEKERHRMLLEINNAIIANLDRRSLFDAVSQILGRTLSFDRASLTLLDPETDTLQMHALGDSLLPDSVVKAGTEFPRRGSHLARVFDQKRPLVRPDLQAEHRIGLENGLLEQGIRSYVAVPLMRQGEAFGTLNIGSRTPNRYAEGDADLLAEVAQQVALAVENTLAHEEIAALKSRLEQENLYLQEEIETEHNFGDILGESAAIKNLLKAIETVAPTEVNVVITGETGTGKELVARALHNLSSRKHKTLIKVNCASIPKELFESEFFGHVRGAFTGALRDRVGRFELADKGTLFLDEVGEIPLDMQSKLLRVLQEGEFERIGDERTRRVDVRIIAATNRDLKQEAEAGRFRRDLYYRLNVFPIEVVPLRLREEDIPALAAHYLRQVARTLKRPCPTLTQAGVLQLLHYDWPGNVRELQNVIERAVITCGSGPLQLDLPSTTVGQPSPTNPPVTATLGSDVGVIPEAQRKQRERENILAALRQTQWKVYGQHGAAAILGVKPSTLASRIKKLGLKRAD